MFHKNAFWALLLTLGPSSVAWADTPTLPEGACLESVQVVPVGSYTPDISFIGGPGQMDEFATILQQFRALPRIVDLNISYRTSNGTLRSQRFPFPMTTRICWNC